MSLTHHLSMRCEGCGQIEMTEYDEADMPTAPLGLVPRGWIAVKFHGKIAPMHLCPKCLPLVTFSVTENKAVLMAMPVTIPFKPDKPN